MTDKNETLSIICWQWNDGFRKYLPQHVNWLAAACKQHCSFPHRFVCITDETKGFSNDVEVMPIPDSARPVARLRTVEQARFPSSYRRLWGFSEEATVLGDRILNLDVDCMVVSDLWELFNNDHDFVGWRPQSVWGKEMRIGGGTWLLRTGTHTHVWDNFSIEKAREARRIGWRGSDQAWMSYCLAHTCKVWPRYIGIYQKQDGAQQWREIPKGARIIHFNGHVDYWDLRNKIKWVDDYICKVA